MNILTVADFLYPAVTGGASVVVHEVMRRLAARGHRISLLTRNSVDLPLSVEGMPVYSYHTPRKEALYPLAVLRGLKVLSALLRRETFDVVNSHHAYSGFAVEVCRRLGWELPSIYYFHGPWYKEAIAKESIPAQDSPPMYLRFRCRKSIERSILKSSTQVIGLSNYMLSEAADIFAPVRNKFNLIPGGVDTERFQFAEDPRKVRGALGLPETAVVLLSVRRLSPRMGLDVLIEAMYSIERCRPDVFLFIGGIGPQMEALNEQVVRLGLQRTKLLGYIPDDTLATYYQASDLSVMPSAALEGFGISSLESMSCGTPVLATAIGGNTELVGGVLPEFVIELTDPADLAHKILQMLPTARERNVRVSVRKYAERYSWQSATDSVEEVLEKTAATWRESPR